MQSPMEGKEGRRHRRKSSVTPPTTTTTTTHPSLLNPPPPLLRGNVTPDAEPRSYHLPLLFAVLPPLGSLFVGTTDAWSDAVTLIVAAFYLYNLVRVPWELYQDVHLKLYPYTVQPISPDTLSSEQREAVARLRWHERLLFALVLASPLLGGLILLVLQRALLTTGSRYLTPNTILLYVLAASIRPLSHAVHRIQARATVLAVDATYPADPVHELLASFTRVERELADLRIAAATRSDLEETRDELEHAVESVARALRQFARKEEQARNTVDVRLDTVESRVRGVEEWCEVQRVQAAQQSLVVRCVWEPVTVLKEAVGVSKAAAPVAASPSRGLLGFSSSKS